MSAIDDAKRFVQLTRAGLVTANEPLDVIDDLLRHMVRYGSPSKLIDENQRLRTAIVEAESRVSDAVGKAFVLAKQNEQLQTTLSTQTECQTPVGQRTRSMNQIPSPEIVVDRRLEDPTFVACRNERCTREGFMLKAPARRAEAPNERSEISMREIDLNAPSDSELPLHTFMIYGATRTGKTTFAGTMPRPLFLSDLSEKGFTSLAEKNWNNVATPLFEPNIRPIVWGIEKMSDMAESIEKVKPLIKAGRVCSIVIDSATFYADLYLNFVLMAQKARDNRQAYDQLGAHLRNIRIEIQNLGVNVCWLALEQAPEYNDDKILVYKGKPMIPGKQADKFMAGVDFIFRATIDRPQPSKPPIFQLRSKEYANYIAGNRLCGRDDVLTDPFSGTYATMMTTLGYDVDKIRAALPKMGDVPKITMPTRPPIATKSASPTIRVVTRQ